MCFDAVTPNLIAKRSGTRPCDLDGLRREKPELPATPQKHETQGVLLQVHAGIARVQLGMQIRTLVDVVAMPGVPHGVKGLADSSRGVR